MSDYSTPTFKALSCFHIERLDVERTDHILKYNSDPQPTANFCSNRPQIGGLDQ